MISVLRYVWACRRPRRIPGTRSRRRILLVLLPPRSSLLLTCRKNTHRDANPRRRQRKQRCGAGTASKEVPRLEELWPATIFLTRPRSMLTRFSHAPRSAAGAASNSRLRAVEPKTSRSASVVVCHSPRVPSSKRCS